MKQASCNDAECGESSIFKSINGSQSKNKNNDESKETNMQSIFKEEQLKQDNISPVQEKPQGLTTDKENTRASEKNANFVTLKADLGVALGYAIFQILILGSDLQFLSLHQFPLIKIGTIPYMHCIVSIKSLILALHLFFYAFLCKFQAFRRRSQRYLFYWELFMIIAVTHLSSVQEYILDDNDNHDEDHDLSEKVEALLLQIYNFWALYLLFPLSILKNEVRMRPIQQQMRYSTILIICSIIKLYPGYLIVSSSEESLLSTSFISRIIIIDIIHSIVVYVIRSMLFQIQFLKEEQEDQSKSTINEVKNLLEKMPEGILIMPDIQMQHCYMNQELTNVLSSIGILKESCCCPDAESTPQEHIPEDYNEEEAFSGLYLKIFKKYRQQEDQMKGVTTSGQVDDSQMKISHLTKRSTIKNCQDKSTHSEDMFSLRDIIDSSDWDEDQERFFEIIMTQFLQNDKEGTNSETSQNPQNQQDRVFVQIKRLNVEYLQQKAKMIVIRDISLIIEFEKEKNENKYQELLTATMSHEMLTPLNSIINLSMYLEQRLSQRQEKEQQNNTNDVSRGGVSHKVELKKSIVFLNIIKSSANILQFLIKDMIDLMNLRLDRFNQQTEVFSPIDACNEILIYYEFQAHEKGLYLNKIINNEARCRIIKLASDKQRYMQILLNIVQNSVKFTYYGGVDIILDFKPHLVMNDTHSSQITPRSKIAKFSQNYSNGCQDCGNLITIIKDTGIGIPKANVERLFKIFGNVNRGQHSSLITTQGIGLGLTICKQLVEKLGGQINLSSEPNTGTEVQFSLPAKCVQCFRHQTSKQSDNSRHFSSLTFNAVPNFPLQEQPNKNVPFQIDAQKNINGSFTTQNAFHNNTKNIIPHQGYSQSRGVGNSQAYNNYKTLNKSITFNSPMTPQVNKQKRRPFGGDISIAQSFNGINRNNQQIAEPFDQSMSQKQLIKKDQFGESDKAHFNQRQQQLDDEIMIANQPQQEMLRDQQLCINSIFNTQSIPNRSNMIAMGSIKSKFTYKSPHLHDELNDSSQPYRPSNEESKSRCISDSHNGVVIASEFANSFHMSIHDKLMKKSFATKVLHENNQRINQMINKNSQQQQRCIIQEKEPQIEKSQDIRNLLQSSNISINEENSQAEMPFLYNNKIKMSVQSPHNDCPNQQNGQSKIEKNSIRCLEPYLEQITKQNDLKVVNILNQHQSTVEVNKILIGDNSIGDYDQIDPDQQNLNSREQIKSQLIAQKMIKCTFIDGTGRLIQNKSQTGFFPTFQKTNLNLNDKLFCDQNQSKFTCHEDVKLNIDLNKYQLLSSTVIEGKKQKEIILSADITPQFNQVIQNDCPELINNQTEKALAIKDEINKNGNNLIINHNKDDKMKQRSLRDMLFQPRQVKQEKKVYEKSLNNDHYQGIATFSLNPEPDQNTSQINNQFSLQEQRLENKKSKKFSTLEEEDEQVQESNQNMTKQDLNQQSIKQNHKEEGKNHDEINIKEIQKAIINNENSGQNKYNKSKKYSQNGKAKDCSCESTVLIVDDNFFNLLPLELILRETFGIKTDKALNGQEAVTKFINYNLQKYCECGVRYKLVLMDLNMPIMDGYKASREILRLHKLYLEEETKQNPIPPKNAGSGESSDIIARGAQNNPLYIVAVTAFVNEENINHCYESGMSEVIHKPLSQENIKQVLEKFYYLKEPIQHS